MRQADVAKMISRLKEDLQKEGGEMSHRASYTKYEDWKAKGLKMNDDENKSLSRSLRGHRSSSSKKKSAGPEVLPLDSVQQADKKQVCAAAKRMAKVRGMCTEYLVVDVFPKTMKFCKKKMQVSGYDLGSSILFQRRFGFTGTPTDLLPQELLVPLLESGKDIKTNKPIFKEATTQEELLRVDKDGADKYGADYAKGTEADIMKTLTNPKICNVWDACRSGLRPAGPAGIMESSTGEKGPGPEKMPGGQGVSWTIKNWSVESLLTLIAESDFLAFIDCGALVTGFDNEEAAQYLLKNGLTKRNPPLKGCVFLDSNDKKMVAMAKGGKPVPLESCGLAWNERFTYYDAVHIVGIDIKQSADAKACVSISKGTPIRDFKQACWRMRGIETGQQIVFLVVNEVWEQVAMMRLKLQSKKSKWSVMQRALYNPKGRQELGLWGVVNAEVKKRGKEPCNALHALMMWMMANQFHMEKLQASALQQQSIVGEWRHGCLKNLLDSEAPAMTKIKELKKKINMTRFLLHNEIVEKEGDKMDDNEDLEMDKAIENMILSKKDKNNLKKSDRYEPKTIAEFTKKFIEYFVNDPPPFVVRGTKVTRWMTSWHDVIQQVRHSELQAISHSGSISNPLIPPKCDSLHTF